MLSRLLCIAAVAIAGQTASAATTTFNFLGQVTSAAITSGGTDFGTNGDTATASFAVTATPGEAIPVGPVSGGTLDITVNSPNFSYAISVSPQGFNDGFNSSIAVSTTGMLFATSSGTFTWPNYAGNTLRTTFRIDFGQTLASAPSTFDDLIAAINLPTISATYKTNGDFLFSQAPGQIFTEYAAAFEPVSAPQVPTPLAGLMLVTGLGAMAMARRRR